MTDKVQKILSEIQTRKLCTMDEHMAFYNDAAKEDYRFLSEIEELIKSLQEKPVSEDLEKIVEEIAEPTILNAYGTKELARRLRNTICSTSVSEDLGEYINELSKQFPEVSFAKLSRIAVRVSRWQRNQDVKNKLPKVINRTELDEYAYQCAYDMSNDWAIENPTWHDVEDACKLGAKWQKEKEYTCYEEAFEDGAAWKDENLWKPADGDDLPEIDKEVIALEGLDEKNYYRVVFAHRVDSDRVIKTTIDNKPLELHPSKYGKVGWNLPNLKYWLDLDLPNKNE